MDQFPTAFMGGYRKDLVDERLKNLVTQIEDLQKEVQAAKRREEQLTETLSAATSRAGILEEELKAAQTGDSPVSQREEKLREELTIALEQLERLSAEEQGGTAPGISREQETQRKKELADALRWSESLEAELKLAREERDARARNRLLELEHTKALSQRILELEAEQERQETAHRRELARLQEQLDQQHRGCEAAGRILAQAEQEARVLIEEAQARAQRLEQEAEDDIYNKKQAAAQALEGARTQVIHYLETFTITRDKLAVTYNELDALVGQMPKADDFVIELDRDGLTDDWGYSPDRRT